MRVKTVLIRRSILVVPILTASIAQVRLIVKEWNGWTGMGIGSPQEGASYLPQSSTATSAHCAINLFGLPRAFKSLVLPSLIKNVIIPNAPYNCDYYVHYYNLKEEAPGRSGRGGALRPQEVHLLEEAVHQHGASATLQRTPVVRFTVTEEEDFWKQYKPLLNRTQLMSDKMARNHLYFPWNSPTYVFPVTVINIIKMWHSIQEAWSLMAQQSIEYTRVAMLRSDVLYMTPIDMFEYPDRVVIPAFGRYPVSDRLIIGPAAAVKVWATQRFSSMDEHARFMNKNFTGFGMHSERFIKFTILPAIAKVLNATEENFLVQHPSLCFFRARADETVWSTDCDDSVRRDQELALHSVRANVLNGTVDMRSAVERVLGRPCKGVVLGGRTNKEEVIDCSRSKQQE